MATVFDVFSEVPMTYVVLNRARVYGNLIKETKQINGVFKVRSGFNTLNGLESSDSSATVHVHPQDFNDVDSIVGNGIIYDGIDYEITGLTVGRNFDNNEVEHYRLTLNRSKVLQNSSQSEIESEFV